MSHHKSQLRVDYDVPQPKYTALSFARCLIADHDWVDMIDGKDLHISLDDARITGRKCFRCGKEERCA